jgi:hypothetical protein
MSRTIFKYLTLIKRHTLVPTFPLPFVDTIEDETKLDYVFEDETKLDYVFEGITLNSKVEHFVPLLTEPCNFG